MITRTASANVLISASPATKAKKTVTINQVAHQTIEVYNNVTPIASGEQFQAGTKLTIKIVPDLNYTAGTVQITGAELDTTDNSFIIGDENVVITATASSAIKRVITIVQSVNQEVQVWNGSTQIASGDEIQTGTTLTVQVIASEGYTAGTPQLEGTSLINGSFSVGDNDITVSAAEATIIQSTVTIIQVENQTISVRANGKDIESGTSLPYGTSIYIYIEPDVGYEASDIILTGTEFAANNRAIVKDQPITITAAASSLQAYPVTIIQAEHQTISVSHNNVEITSGEEVPYGTTLLVTITPDEGYTAGTVSLTGAVYDSSTRTFTVQQAVSVTVGTVGKESYMLTIEQSEHQTITITANGNTYTSSVSLPFGTEWTASVQADTGYTAGTLSATSGIITTGTNSISVSAATPNGYVLDIVQSEHQTITVTANGNTYTSSVTLPYSTEWIASVTAEEGYIAGALSQTSGTLTGNTSITVSNVSLKLINITLVQNTHETITATYKNVQYTDSFSAYAHDDILFTVKPKMWWAAGNLVINSETQSSTEITTQFSKDTTITAADATQQKHYTLTIGIENSDYWNSVGMNIAETIENPYGSILPDEILDTFCIVKDKSASHICFYGTDSVEGLFNYCTMILTAPDGSEYAMAVNIPNSDFNTTGDIENNAEFTLQLKVLTSLIGQLCTLDIYLTDELYDYEYDLSYYAVNYIDDYDTATEIPAINLAFLNKGIAAKKINAFLSCGDKRDSNHEEISSSKALLTVPKLAVGTSKCTSMYKMFYKLSSATSIDTSWIDTSNATSLKYMFSECSSLTSLDVSNFDTSNVIDMSHMFYHCRALTSLDVSNFNTSKVTDMSGMFASLRDIQTCKGLDKLDTSKVTDMADMFLSWPLTSLNVSNFDTSNVTSMHWMFFGCLNLTSLDVSNFNTSKVTDMSGMFAIHKIQTLTGLDKFDTSKVTNFAIMFNGNPLTSIEGLENWNTSNVTSMFGMFSSSKLKTISIPNWNTSKVTNMQSLFNSLTLTEIDISNWDTSKVTDMRYMFGFTDSSRDPVITTSSPLTTIKGVLDMSSCTKYDYMFGDTPNLTGVQIKNPPFDPTNAEEKAAFEEKAKITSSQYTIVS